MSFSALKNKLAATCCIFCIHFLGAQENNYWMTDYGAHSTLLGGAVVSTYCDNGAMYYNPATLSFKDSGFISLSADLYGIERLRMNNALGSGLHLSDITIGTTPQMISGNLKKWRKIDAGFILLTKNAVDFSLNQTNKNQYYMYPTYSVADSAHLYDYLADYSGHFKIIEQWGGLCMSYKTSPHFSVGFTSFVTYRYQKYNTMFNISALGLDDSLNRYYAKMEYSRNFTFDNINNVTKLGLAWSSEHLDAGLTVTLPSFRIWSLGSSVFSWYYSNTTKFVNTNYVIYDKESKLNITYKTPLSIAGGVCLKFNNTKIYLSAEYFHTINPYVLYSTHKDQKKNNTSVQFYSDDVTGEKKYASRVINGALGFEQKLGQKVTLVSGIKSDFSSFQRDSIFSSNNYYTFTYLNIWHGSLGVKLQLKKKSIVAGFTGAYGFMNGIYQLANTTNPSNIEYSLMQGTPEDKSSHIYWNARFVLGFSY